MWEAVGLLTVTKLRKQFGDWAIKRRLWLTSARTPGRLNREADVESRKTELRIE